MLCMVACMVTLSHCAGASVQREVRDNLFTSSNAPKIAVKIHPDLTYMGKSEVTRSIPTTFGSFEGRKVPVTYTRYLFCEIGENKKMRKMCGITFSRILDQDTVHPNAPLKGAEYDRSPGMLKTGEKTDQERYKAVGNPLSHGIHRFFYDAGFTTDLSIAVCYLFKTVTRTVSKDSKTLMVIDYAGNVKIGETCQEWNRSVTVLTEGQKDRIGEFLRNSNEYIQILMKGETDKR